MPPFDDREMQKALEADGEKLRQLTGEDHGPQFEYDEDFEDSDPEEDAWAEAEMNCSMDRHGQCGQAGSEYCEFECPFRD